MTSLGWCIGHDDSYVTSFETFVRRSRTSSVEVRGIEPPVSRSRTARDTTSPHLEIFVAAGGLEPHPERLMKPPSRSPSRREGVVSGTFTQLRFSFLLVFAVHKAKTT